MRKFRGVYKPPFGYDVTEDGYLIPIEDDLSLLTEMKEMLDGNALSLRDAAIYITMKSSRSITYEGLRLRLKRPVDLSDEVSEEIGIV